MMVESAYAYSESVVELFKTGFASLLQNLDNLKPSRIGERIVDSRETLVRLVQHRCYPYLGWFRLTILKDPALIAFLRLAWSDWRCIIGARDVCAMYQRSRQ